MATKEEVVEKLKQVIDPELYIDVWTLGLIYDIILDEGKLDIKMTFTSIACPAGPQLVQEIKDKMAELPSITSTNVEVVFTPPWEPSEDLKAMLGIG
ncbi:MAG: metal-sulfur cluster assembly factor [Bdellovibrionota bacterium]